MPRKDLEARKEYYQENREQKCDYNRSYYKEPGKTYIHRLWHAEENYLLKVKVLTHYSNPRGSMVCNTCGEQSPDALCIDHIKGGGYKHFSKLNKRGSNFYRWLIKNDYPEGFQVLCANCNLIKRRLDVSRNRNFVQ